MDNVSDLHLMFLTIECTCPCPVHTPHAFTRQHTCVNWLKYVLRENNVENRLSKDQSGFLYNRSYIRFNLDVVLLHITHVIVGDTHYFQVMLTVFVYKRN